MKALSVKQPWAELEARGVKTLEIRGRNTHHRGALAIHASSRYDAGPSALQAAAEHLAAPKQSAGQAIRALPLGRIVAVVDLTASDPWEPGLQGEACTPWKPSAWAWTLANARRADSPFPLKGQLGLWDVPDSAVQVRP